MTELELIIDLHKNSERQGPGSEKETLKALECMNLSNNRNLKIADIGCGSGGQTITLAQNLNGEITAVDLFPEFLAELKEKSENLELRGEIKTLEKSMDDLLFNNEELDIIWAEGAIYNIGFENGIKKWKDYLKVGGYLAVSEITWITNSRPKEIEDYWTQAYPEIDIASNKIKQLENNGYSLVAYFYLSQDSWIESYYKPMEERFKNFLERNDNSELARKVVKENQAEIDLYLKFKDYYSYGFYIARKDSNSKNRLVRNFILINSLLLLLFGCKNEANMIKCKGIPDVNQSFSYMYFKTENEGYLFGTYTEYEELSEKALENPNNIPKSTNEANIYKTIDGGLNWSKIDSINDYSYSNIATQLNDGIYILKDDVRTNYKSSIACFSLKNEDVKDLINTKPISAIWNGDSAVFYTNNRSSIKLYSLDKNQKIDSINIKNYALQGLSLKNKPHAIFSSRETSYFGRANEGNKKVELFIIPKSIVKQDENNILIAGNTITDDDEISLLSYDVNTNKSKIIKKFKDYSIIRNLQSNDKAIIGFIGNIKGVFIEYDLLYSLDKGETWKIKKLKESSYVRPSCLINNIVYIYSGGARMQKIALLDDDNGANLLTGKE